MESDLDVWHFGDLTFEYLGSHPKKIHRDMYLRANENHWVFNATYSSVKRMTNILYAGKSSFYLTNTKYNFHLRKRLEMGLPKNMNIFKVSYM